MTRLDGSSREGNIDPFFESSSGKMLGGFRRIDDCHAALSATCFLMREVVIPFLYKTMHLRNSSQLVPFFSSVRILLSADPDEGDELTRACFLIDLTATISALRPNPSARLHQSPPSPHFSQRLHVPSLPPFQSSSAAGTAYPFGRFSTPH
jgi:hypothetical protein